MDQLKEYAEAKRFVWSVMEDLEHQAQEQIARTGVKADKPEVDISTIARLTVLNKRYGIEQINAWAAEWKEEHHV